MQFPGNNDIKIARMSTLYENKKELFQYFDNRHINTSFDIIWIHFMHYLTIPKKF